MKLIFRPLLAVVLILGSWGSVFAMSKDAAIDSYKQELVALGVDPSNAGTKAMTDVQAVVFNMLVQQSDASASFEAMEERVKSILKNDLRYDVATDSLKRAETLKDDFTDMNAENHLYIQGSIAGAPPLAMEDDKFKLAREALEDEINDLNRLLIAPNRPGSVPSGDVVSDFLPQIIRQLFGFAWVAIFISFTVSGIMLIVAMDDEEKITKARGMIYFTLIGFAFVTLAFAIVKAVTNIDFFRFIIK